VLTGERVTLRGVERDDLPRLWEMYNDLEVEHRASDGPPVPTPLATVEARFDARVPHSPDLVKFVILTNDGEADDLIGEILLHTIDRYSQSCHLGISLRRDRWGQGYGQDAITTLLGYAFRKLNFRKVSLEVLADDQRAVGAYRKAGFTEEGRLRAHTWHDGCYRDVLRMAVFQPARTGSG
jgi:RimJ/RimL family protein N-acetyltransferase